MAIQDVLQNFFASSDLSLLKIGNHYVIGNHYIIQQRNAVN